MKNMKPMVDWQSPDLVPNVKDGDSETFWIAVQRNRNGESPIFVFDAQYINKPLKLISINRIFVELISSQ